MLDLFGNEGWGPTLPPEPEPFAPTLFDHVAERDAIATGKPVSQVRTELVHGDTPVLLPSDMVGDDPAGAVIAAYVAAEAHVRSFGDDAPDDAYDRLALATDAAKRHNVLGQAIDACTRSREERP